MSIESSYADLVDAMFIRLRKDLRGETTCSDRRERVLLIGDAIAFLADPQFEWWCSLCGAPVEAVRASMLAEIPEQWRWSVGDAEQDG